MYTPIRKRSEKTVFAVLALLATSNLFALVNVLAIRATTAPHAPHMASIEVPANAAASIHG